MTMLKVKFDSGPEIAVELREDETPTVERLREAVPFKAEVNRWGDEVYFETPVSAQLESDARAEMEVGDVAFWPDGSALAIFFGRTPVSDDDKPRAYSPCNIVGTVRGDVSSLKLIQTGAVAEVSSGPSD